MLFGLFRRKAYVTDENNNVIKVNTNKNMWVFTAILVAIGILLFGSCDEPKEKNEKKKEDGYSVVCDEYAKDMTEKLEKILSQVKGAGKVNVMMSFDTFEEKVLASDTKNSVESQQTENSLSNSSSEEETVMTVGSGNEEHPVVLSKKLPMPSGVLVTATGAGNEKVRLELYESVKALYGISGHRIKITAADESNKK